MTKHEVELPNPEELEEAKSKSFTRRTALITAVFAVFLAVVSLGGNHATKEVSLSQQQASDQWAFYQSKSMREHLYRIEKMRLESELLEKGTGLTPEARQHKDALLEKVTKESERYADEKKEIEEKAKELESERDRYRVRDPYFDFGEVLLQIAIVLASMSILTGARPIFYTAMAAAGLGLALGLNGFFLFFKLPFL
jgi:hypothetical protein